MMPRGGPAAAPPFALAFMAPEALNGHATCLSDVYSFGCVLLCMSTGRESPFTEDAPGLGVGLGEGQACAVGPGGSSSSRSMLQWPDDMCPQLRQLGESCLARDPKKRPSFFNMTLVGG